MSFSLSPEDVKKSTQAPRRPYFIGIIIWLAFAFAGVMLILNYGLTERERALVSVQRNLGEVAAARAADVSGWLAAQRAPLAKFAGDADVRLNVFQIEEPSADLDLGARGYLRNWLADLADKNGFTPQTSADLGASAEVKDLTSLAVVDKSGQTILAIGAFPVDDEHVKSALKDGAGFIDLFAGPDGRLYLGFIETLFDMNGTAPDNRLGAVVGIKVADELFQKLQQPGGLYKSGEALLLRQLDGTAQVISPLAGRDPLSVTLDMARKTAVEVSAVAAPGSFAEGENYAGQRTLAGSRAVEGAPWTLSYEVSHAEVMGQTDSRISYQILIFMALLGLVLFFLYAAWKSGAARIASEKALEYGALARKFEFQSKLLRLVTDSQRNHILIADTDGKVRFANAMLARDMGTTSEDMLGKPLAAAVGAEGARRFSKRAQEANISNKAVITVDRVDLGDDKFRVVQTQHIPVEDSSAGPGEGPTRGTLIVEEDITDVVLEREKRERTLKQVVESLVGLVDRRDPYAAEHSVRVSRVARAIAAEMNLSDIDTDACEMAGALMNLGKLLVPAELLTKHGALDEDEMKAVRDSIIASADTVAGIEFEGPVVPTLRQALEKVDGSGFPDSLKGDDILLTARIVAVANAFVALISPRAHRKGLDIDTAVKTLLEQADKAYDRGVVAALVSYIDNKGGREEWAPPPEDEPLPEADEDNPWQR